MRAINYSLRTALFRAYMRGVWQWWQPCRNDAAEETRSDKKAPFIIRELKEDSENTR